MFVVCGMNAQRPIGRKLNLKAGTKAMLGQTSFQCSFSMKRTVARHSMVLSLVKTKHCTAGRLFLTGRGRSIPWPGSFSP